MYHRKQTRPVRVGALTIGGSDTVVIQSMTTTKTADVKATVEQIHRLEEAGCQVVRVTVNTMEAAEAIKEIKRQIHIPLVADIHFDYRLALKAIENGIDKVRINPGNIGKREKVEAVVKACKERGVPIRIGSMRVRWRDICWKSTDIRQRTRWWRAPCTIFKFWRIWIFAILSYR